MICIGVRNTCALTIQKVWSLAAEETLVLLVANLWHNNYFRCTYQVKMLITRSVVKLQRRSALSEYISICIVNVNNCNALWVLVRKYAIEMLLIIIVIIVIIIIIIIIIIWTYQTGKNRVMGGHKCEALRIMSWIWAI